MAQTGTDEYQGRVAIRETTHLTGAAADLPVQPSNDVVGYGYEFSVRWENRSRSVFLQCHPLPFGRLFRLHGLQSLHHNLGFLLSCFLALLRMDRPRHLSHQLHLGARRYGEHIAVEVDGTALVFGLGEHFTHGLQHTKTLITNNEVHPIQATATQPLEEAALAGLILLHILGNAKNLAVSVLIDCNRCQYDHVFVSPPHFWRR